MAAEAEEEEEEEVVVVAHPPLSRSMSLSRTRNLQGAQLKRVKLRYNV